MYQLTGSIFHSRRFKISFKREWLSSMNVGIELFLWARVKSLPGSFISKIINFGNLFHLLYCSLTLKKQINKRHKKMLQ